MTFFSSWIILALCLYTAYMMNKLVQLMLAMIISSPEEREQLVSYLRSKYMRQLGYAG